MPSNPKKKAAKSSSPYCKRCRRTIRVPAGWSGGSATRKHYWAKHPDVMRPKLGKRR